MKKGSEIADEIISDWNREKYIRKLSERIKKGRDKDGRSILRNRPTRND